MRRVGAPRRMVNILEGESLFNDATALVVFKVALGVALGEAAFSAGHTVLDFFKEAGGGIAVGFAAGFVIAEVRKRVDDVNTELTISLFSAYGAFIPADLLGVSGRPRRRHVRHLPRLPRAGDRLAGEPHAGLRAVVDPHVPAQRRAVHPHRAAAAGDRGRAERHPDRGRDPLHGGRLRDGDRGALHLELHRHVPDPGARPAALAGRAPRRLAQPRGRRLVGHARRGVAGGRALAAGGDGRRRAAPGPRADPVHHVRADLRHRGRAGADPALADPQARARRRQPRGGARGAARPADDRPRRARQARRARGGGLDARRHDRARPPAVRVPPAALQDPRGQDRRRGRPRGGLASSTSG